MIRFSFFSFLSAWRLLTIIPFPFFRKTLEKELRQAPLAFASIGLFLGFLFSLSYAFFLNFFPSLPSAFLAILVQAIVTGSFHLDGLADSFDALVGGHHRSVAKRIEIMKDSRVGAFGSVALFMVLSGKIVTLASIDVYSYLNIIVLVPMLSRMTLVFLIYKFPYVGTKDGLGWSYASQSFLVPLFNLSLCLVFGYIFFSWQILYFTGISFIPSLALAFFAKRKLGGGLVGDTYGASVEIVELTLLYAILALP